MFNKIIFLWILGTIGLSTLSSYAYELSQEERTLRSQWRQGLAAQDKGDIKTAQGIFEQTCKAGYCRSCGEVVKFNLQAENAEAAREYFPFACDCSDAEICARIAGEAKDNKDTKIAKKYYARACQIWQMRSNAACKALSEIDAVPIRISPAFPMSNEDFTGGWEKEFVAVPRSVSNRPIQYRFDPPIDMDWSRVVKDVAKEKDIEHPSRDFMKKLILANKNLSKDGPVASVTFAMPLDAATEAHLNKQKLVLFLPHNIVQLKPIGLQPALYYYLEDDLKGVKNLRYFGDLLAAPPTGNRIKDGGFVFSLGSDVKIGTTTLSNEDIANLIPDSEEKTRFKSGYRIHIGASGIDYVFISWARPKSGASCEKEYDLYEVPNPKLILPKVHLINYSFNCGD